MSDYQRNDRRRLAIYWLLYKSNRKRYDDEKNSVEYRNKARLTMIEMIGAIRRKEKKLGLKQAYFTIPPPIEVKA